MMVSDKVQDEYNTDWLQSGVPYVWMEKFLSSAANVNVLSVTPASNSPDVDYRDERDHRSNTGCWGSNPSLFDNPGCQIKLA